MTASRQNHRWWQLDPQRVLVLALFIALLAMSAREIADPDFWWHLATGRYIVETRSIPHHDVFSYTATDHKWITHEWLTQVGMIALYSGGGLTALQCCEAREPIGCGKAAEAANRRDKGPIQLAPVEVLS